MADYAEDAQVLVWYPPQGADEHDRSTWAWLPGIILQRCDEDEWQVFVDVRELATLEDGSPAPEDAPEETLIYPTCFRDSSEIRPAVRTR